jgi:hypothetical protein
MSLIHSPEDKIARPILQAVADAIKALETVAGSLAEHEIGREDDESFTRAKRLLWSILENNGFTIDIDTNRLRNAIN